MARPYRSHKVPACEPCRKRKIRCSQDVEGAPCDRCRRLGKQCHSGRNNNVVQDSINTTDLSHNGIDNTLSPVAGAASAPTGNAGTPMGMSRTTRASSAVLMVGAELSEDVNILHSYLSTHRPTDHELTTPYHTVHGTPEEAVVYVSVPRGRAGLELARNPGKAQLEALQQLLGPSHHEELLALFERHVQPYFPIVDLSAFSTLERAGDKFPSTLLCYIYVLSLRLWDNSPTLQKRPQPDIAYATNLAVAALQGDFLSPTVSTVAAAILDLLGRPVKSVTTNILTAGKLVALAHSHGLHRDPTRWSSPPEPIPMRKRLWWAVLVHDHWGSCAHGTPPNISANRHDVPMVEPVDYAAIPPGLGGRQTSGSFTQLCMLTQILGELLNMIHNLNTDWSNVSRILRKIECELDDWEATVCRLYDINPRSRPPSGHCSLWLSYLSVKLLVQRLYLRAAASQTALPVDGEKQYRTISLRASAIIIVDFLASLTRDHFQEFWVSYTAHLLVSTAIMLLRCTIETRDEGAHGHCILKLTTLRTTLAKASTECGWDIADLCLERCSEAIDRVAQAQSTTTGHSDLRRANPGSTQPHVNGGYAQTQVQEQDMFDPAWLNQTYPALDLSLPPDSLDFLWDGM